MLTLAGGLLIVAAPAVVDFLDGREADAHRLEAEAWIRRDMVPEAPSLPPPGARTVIVPGAQGYLLEIPAIGLRAVVRQLEPAVFSGKNTPLLKRYGLGQVPYTESLRNVSPGGNGTAAITGHRTTSGAPFRKLDRLRPGDLIYVRSGGIEQQWEVVRSVSVLPGAVESIRSQPGSRILVLLACNPPFSARERLIVYARLKREGVRLGAVTGADEATPHREGGVQ